ncbi:hypothetical protein EMIHUDRAFT_219955 [Emiliania huxleyi CCMP1516]|uniref:Uncharacterized protein n=2 Tax=Emiliania huxleyi TaxID=2903 RepID=A0A0D3I3J4_EMIH1|nr:hypothetical protein EMIHUDRAFT_219955 [Emiliania huxleyi CCMP1516]EOD05829.1 hypothetical protein EMIHUDRAFT_219955 [Emiliania huxleyi CCMP1516]|eukprot:XP_005758258.1 hypothetical protein EMIHUDRAFT_219955 [Emiliania huxleyi CCMP1516]
MVLVASEPISAGGEIRIDYEGGSSRAGSGSTAYWGAETGMGEPREDGAWRAAVVDGLARLQSAARASQGGEDVDAASAVLACSVADETAAPLPWGGERGGDARLRLLVPSLAKKLAGLRARVASCQWGIVASHLPGRTGAECRERRVLIFLGPLLRGFLHDRTQRVSL